VSSDPLKRVTGDGKEDKARCLVNELGGIECEDRVNTLSPLPRLTPVIPPPSNQSDMGAFLIHLPILRVVQSQKDQLISLCRTTEGQLTDNAIV
jgi:hypothetical protein